MNPRDLIIDAEVLANTNSPEQFASFMHLAVDSDEATRHIVSDRPAASVLAHFNEQWSCYVEGMCHGLAVDVQVIAHMGDVKQTILEVKRYGYEHASESFQIHIYGSEFWKTGSPESDIVEGYDAPHPSMPDFLVHRLNLQADNESPVVVLTDCGNGAFWVTIVGSDNEEE